MAKISSALHYMVQLSGKARLGIGFASGFIFMMVVVSSLVVNSFDLNNMQRGAELVLQGVNPWAPQTRILHYYNPPFAILFFWILLFTSPKVILVLGGSTLFALIFYYKFWTALAWFLTNTFLWIVAAGGIDMLVIGLGLLLLLASDRVSNRVISTILRVIAYGLLMIKPQGGMFIVLFYIFKRRDWKGFLFCVVLYGILFAPLYPSWLSVLRTDPPLAQTEASHSFYAKFGPVISIIIAIPVIFARRWKYWQLGGALAGILAPYGMPGLPIFLVLTAIDNGKASAGIVLYSAVLAMMTWIAPQSGLMGIYHLGMLGLVLILACTQPDASPRDENDIDLRGLFSMKLFRRASPL